MHLTRSLVCTTQSEDLFPLFTDYNLSIKCGGPQITSRINQIVYERDNEALGPATYYVTGTKRWAVSNVGRFGENNNARYTSNSSSQIVDTLDSELFQTARISAGSLRYYGLGLENGYYNVSLQFAEISILNPPDWRSLGRRIFDIYIQVCNLLGNWVRNCPFHIFLFSLEQTFSVRYPCSKPFLFAINVGFCGSPIIIFCF